MSCMRVRNDVSTFNGNINHTCKILAKYTHGDSGVSLDAKFQGVN